MDQAVDDLLQQTAGVEDADDTGDGVQVAHGADHVVDAVNEEAAQGAVLHAHDVGGNQDAADQADDGAGDQAPGAGHIDVALDEGHNQQDGHGDQHDQALGIAVLGQDGLGLSRVDGGAGAAEQGETDGGGGSGHQGVLHTAAHNAGHVGHAGLVGVLLGGGGGDGGVGDGADVIAEDGAAEDGTGQEHGIGAQQQAGGIQDGEGGEHGADGGAGGSGDDAGGNEGEGHEAAAGQADLIAQPHEALGHAAAGHQLAEHAHNQQDQGQLVHNLGGHAGCHGVPVFAPVLGQQGSDDQGHIAAHAQVHHVKGLEDHEEQDAEHHEQQQGDQGEEIRTMKLYVKFFLFHTNSPFVVGTAAHPLSLKK